MMSDGMTRDDIWKAMEGRALEMEELALTALQSKDMKAHAAWADGAKTQREQMRKLRVSQGYH